LSGLEVVKVLFIAGTGRSGTTILSSILGQVRGALNAGEIRYAWERGMLQDQRCGCGEPFSHCPLWRSIVDTAFPGDRRPDPWAVAKSIDGRTRVRRVPGMVLRRLIGRAAIPPRPEDVYILDLYRALSAHPDCQVVVDSSKLPPYGMLLAGLPGVELYVIHMVRDPRATAFSWRRPKSTRDMSAPPTMPLLETWRSAVLWLIWNVVASQWWRADGRRSIVVRYEDLVNEPAEVLGHILDMMKLTADHALVSGHSVQLTPTHSVAGNPGRLDVGRIELYLDDEWRSAMSTKQWALVTWLTWPALHRFGYRVRSTRRPD
jgi:Sulfotransferase domain